MLHRPTLLLLASLSPVLAPVALAQDANKDATQATHSGVLGALDSASNSLNDTFIPFGKATDRDTPPLSPTMIPGGLDEKHALQQNILGHCATPLISQNRPFRALDGYRQYAIYQSAGSPPQWGGWSAEEWDAYGKQFENSITGPDGFDPAQRIRVRQFVVDGPVRFENEQGRTLFEGYNAFISDRAVLRTGNFLFTIEPELRLHNTTRTDYDSRFDPRFGVLTGYGTEDRNGLEIMEATAQMEFFGAHLTLGRESLVWGPGYHQQLIMSANAAPMWMAHLTSAEPMALPGAASKLGYFSPEVFVAYTGHDRPIPDTLESGVRLGWQVNPFIKFGINLISTFGGQGQSVTADDMLFNLTSSTGDQIPNGTHDQKCSWDLSFVSPWQSAPFEAYVENGYETRAKWSDITKLHKGWLNPAWIAGVRLPSLDQDGIFSATFEYAWTGPIWYQPNLTPGNDRAYLYQGVQIGAPMGGDSESWFGEVRAKMAKGTELYASESYEQHGLNAAPVTEVLFQTKLGADVDLGRTTGMFRGWHAEPTVEWDNWRNFQGTSRKENGYALGFSLRRGF